MTQEERRIYLIKELEKEMPAYQEYGIPKSSNEQWLLLRGLFNVRMPGPVSSEFMNVESDLLKEMTRQKGIVDVNDLKPCGDDPRLYLFQGDITTIRCDAIVNAANSQMLGCFRPNHSCIDNAIHTFAGVELRNRCNEIMMEQGHEEETGKAKITPGYNLPAKYVIHTVGPIVMGPLNETHKRQLASCYHSCLELADQNNCESIAFCCISTGVFMFPQDQAAEIAVNTVKKYLNSKEKTNIKKVIFNVFKDEDDRIYNALLKHKIIPHRKAM